PGRGPAAGGPDPGPEVARRLKGLGASKAGGPGSGVVAAAALGWDGGKGGSEAGSIGVPTRGAGADVTGRAGVGVGVSWARVVPLPAQLSARATARTQARQSFTPDWLIRRGPRRAPSPSVGPWGGL